MTMMTKYKELEEYLDELIPNPKCELDYFNDYSLLMAIMLSAQTTDKRVNEVTKVLFKKYPTLNALKEAQLEDLEEIIRPLGSYTRKAYNIKEIARILLDDYQGIVPQNHEDLEKFPGVGRKTANVFLAEFYHIPTIAVDTHVERVSKRLGLVKDDSTVLDIEKVLMQNICQQNWAKRHLQLVLFGRYHCIAKKPHCDICKLHEICSFYKKQEKLKK